MERPTQHPENEPMNAYKKLMSYMPEDNIRAMMVAAFPSDAPMLTEVFELVFADEVSEKFYTAMEASFRECFSEDEAAALADFYESPIGKLMLERMPKVMQSTMAFAEEIGSEVVARMRNPELLQLAAERKYTKLREELRVTHIGGHDRKLVHLEERGVDLGDFYDGDGELTLGDNEVDDYVRMTCYRDIEHEFGVELQSRTTWAWDAKS